MGKLSFEYTEKEYAREANKIVFDGIPDDMNISEFKIMCVRMAHALGFQEKSIQSSFGDLIYGTDKPNELKKLLLDINRTEK